MRISINVDSIVPISGAHLYEIFQSMSPDDCEKIAALEVDGQVWFNEVLTANRHE